MSRKDRSLEENAHREKIRELLQMANIGSMDDIQNLFKETIAEFMENGLEAELEDELGYANTTTRIKTPTTAATATAAKRCAPVSGMWMYQYLEIERGNLSPRY